jgi:hypothetical protein
MAWSHVHLPPGQSAIAWARQACCARHMRTVPGGTLRPCAPPRPARTSAAGQRAMQSRRAGEWGGRGGRAAVQQCNRCRPVMAGGRAAAHPPATDSVHQQPPARAGWCAHPGHGHRAGRTPAQGPRATGTAPARLRARARACAAAPHTQAAACHMHAACKMRPASRRAGGGVKMSLAVTTTTDCAAHTHQQPRAHHSTRTRTHPCAPRRDGF